MQSTSSWNNCIVSVFFNFFCICHFTVALLVAPVACVAAREKREGRARKERFSQAQNPFSLPFQTPATQAGYFILFYRISFQFA